MGFRLRQSFKIVPGVRINVSKSGFSTSIGGRGATVNLSKRGVKSTVGIPGTGLSYSQQSNTKNRTIQNVAATSSGSGSAAGPPTIVGFFAAAGSSFLFPKIQWWGYALVFVAVALAVYGLRQIGRRAVEEAQFVEPEQEQLSFQAVPAPASPTPVEMTPREAYEGNFWDAGAPITLSGTFAIKYVDSNRNLTTRTVDMTAFDLDSGLFIGHCRLRNDRRTFRFDRVQECVDGETGEVIRDLRAHCAELYRTSPRGILDRMVDDNFDTLKVLIYFAKLDSRLTKKERAIIHDFLAALTRDERISAEMTNAVIDDCEVPSLTSFRQAVGRLRKREKIYRECVYEVCKEMAATEKKVSNAEADALIYLQEKFELSIA